MKRLLLVDDEPRVLRGLERSLFSLTDEWEIDTAEGGQQALQSLAAAPYDIVVSDMLMPGMTGAELLNEVMRLYPQTIRIVLSGHATNELLMKCVGAVHQYLSKPCEPVLLLSTIERVVHLNDHLRNPDLRAFATRLRRLPSRPSLYAQILEALQVPEVEIEDIGKIVEKDIGMTSKLLNLANSAFVGLSHQVDSAREAVTYIGIDALKALVLSARIFEQFDNTSMGGLSATDLWRHCNATAAAAKLIATHEGAARATADESFTAGLLHDCGMLVIAGNLNARYADAIRQAADARQPIAEVEKQLWGTTHAEVGGYLMGLWGLPIPIVEAITFHHAPKAHRLPAFAPLTAVHAANTLISERLGSISGLYTSPIDQAYLAQLGIPPDRIQRWRDLAESIPL